MTRKAPLCIATVEGGDWRHNVLSDEDEVLLIDIIEGH
jgi:hypothetical protein